MFVFDSDTLRHLLKQIKNQIDKKIDIEQYLILAEDTDEEAKVVGKDFFLDDPLVLDLIAKGELVDEGTKVLVKEKGLSEANYTQEEKEVVQEILANGGLEEMLKSRLDNLYLELVTKEEYDELVAQDKLVDYKVYFVTDKELKVLDIDNYITQEQYDELAALKVDKVSFTRGEGENAVQVEKVLSSNDFETTYKDFLQAIIDNGGLDSLVFNNEIVDNLESDAIDKPLSANQGKLLRRDYLGGKKHQFLKQSSFDALAEKNENTIYHITDAETLYGLTAEQMGHLKAAYEFSLTDLSQTYADKTEVYNARQGLDGQFFPSLGERLDTLDELIDMLYYDTEQLNNVITGRYGVRFDFEEEEYTRLYNAVGKEGGADFDLCYPWSHMVRCNMIDGEVVAYEGSPEYIEDGSNGDVMVEIPKFWYKVNPLRTEDVEIGEGIQLLEAEWIIADRPYPSYKVHPAFIRNGKEVDKIYVGAFEACLLDAVYKVYDTDDSLPGNASVDKLCSISGVKPASGKNKTLSLLTSRQMTKNKGEGYCVFDFSSLSAIQLLFLIEHASFNSQEIIGRGHVDTPDDFNTNLSINTGSDECVVYRGIENLWGNIWKIIDGHKTSNHKLYWSNDHENIINENNMINFFYGNRAIGSFTSRIGYDENNDFIFIGTKLEGSSNTGLCDFMQINTMTTVTQTLYHGGRWDDSNNSGLWHYYMNGSYENANIRTVGVRIMFAKDN
jgi:hypothetical protein